MAKKAIPKGTALTLDMLAVKVAEPKGIAPEDIFQLVGKKVTIDIAEDESVTEDAVDSYGKKAKAWGKPSPEPVILHQTGMKIRYVFAKMICIILETRLKWHYVFLIGRQRQIQQYKRC